MNNELFEALNILEKEKNISKETLLEAIRQSLHARHVRTITTKMS